MDMSKDYFQICIPQDYHFPITILSKDEAMDPCTSSARRIRDWMLKYKTQPIVRQIPEFILLLCKIRA